MVTAPDCINYQDTLNSLIIITLQKQLNTKNSIFLI